MIAKYNICFKSLLQQGISEPVFYGDLVYKFKRIVWKPDFSDQFQKIIKRVVERMCNNFEKNRAFNDKSMKLCTWLGDDNTNN